MSGYEPRPVVPPPGHTDDEFRAMLEGRAARVTSTDAREVLAGARAEIAGRDGGTGSGAGEHDGRTFGVRPVRIDPQVPGRGSRMPWRVAVLGIAAVVAVAVLGSRLDLEPTDVAPGASPTAPVEVVGNGSPELATLETLTPAQLDAGVLGGNLIGRTVIVVGHLDRRLGDCLLSQPPPDGCWWLVFPGLENRHIDPGSAGYAAVGLALARHGGDEPVALRVLGSEVDLLGWVVVGGAEAPLKPSALDDGSTSLARLELALVQGWLVPPHGEPSCASSMAGSCYGPWPRLTDTSPFVDGTWAGGIPGIDVSYEASFGLDEHADAMTGRFLVERTVQRGGAWAPYHVVATLDPPSAEAVPWTAPTDPLPESAEPQVVCEPNTSTWSEDDANGSPVPIAITLTCASAVAAAKASAGAQPGTERIEFAYGYWCPAGFFCAASMPNTGHVIFRRMGTLPDLLVGVTADAAGRVTATAPGLLPSPSTGE